MNREASELRECGRLAHLDEVVELPGAGDCRRLRAVDAEEDVPPFSGDGLDPLWSGRAPTPRPARACSTWPAPLTAATTSRSPGRSPMWSTSASPTRCRAGSCLTAWPAPGPIASPAWAWPTAPPPAPGPPTPWC